MQIVKQTPSELLLRNQPSWLNKGAIALWALLFSGIPLGMIGVWVYGLGVTQLTCKRVEPTQVSCDRTQSRLLGVLPGSTTTFNQVTAAKTKAETSTAGNGTRVVDYWVVLHTLNGEVSYLADPIRINGRKGSAQEMQAITDQINSFLESDQTALNIQRDMRLRLGHSLFPIMFMGLFVLIGGTVVYFAFRSEVLVFNKKSQLFRCDRVTLLGKQTWQYPLHEIQNVTVDIQTDRDGDFTYTLKLLPEDGKLILMPGQQEQIETACSIIRDFLKLSPRSTSVAVENYIVPPMQTQTGAVQPLFENF